MHVNLLHDPLQPHPVPVPILISCFSSKSSKIYSDPSVSTFLLKPLPESSLMVFVPPQRLRFSQPTVRVWTSLHHTVGCSVLSASLSSETSSHEHYHEQPTFSLFPCCSQSLSLLHDPCFFQPHLVALSPGHHLLLPFYSVEDSFTGILSPFMTDHFRTRSISTGRMLQF